MGTIAQLGAVTIVIHYNDHPPPHFHARYQGKVARIRIDPVAVMDSNLPSQQERKVLNWARAHQHELKANWNRAELHLQLERIGSTF